jgi:hypothetical protein
LFRRGHVRFARRGHQVWTRGLSRLNEWELRVEVTDCSLLAEAEAFLRFVTAYVKQYEVRISPNETLLYGFWITRFQAAEAGFLDVWEANFSVEEFIPGGSRTVTYWRDQHHLCAQSGAEFAPPRLDLLAAVSEGVFEGDPVEGIRYPSRDPMSGWFLSTDRYNGDIKTMRCEHLYHIAEARPDLVRYLSLPPGFWFNTTEGERGWRQPTEAGSNPV